MHLAYENILKSYKVYVLAKTFELWLYHNHFKKVLCLQSALFQTRPLPIGPIGGSTFWIFSVIFGPMVPKTFLEKILDTWRSWLIFFGSLFVSGQNKGRVKIKIHQKLHFLFKMTKMHVKKKFKNHSCFYPILLTGPQNSKKKDFE